MSRDNVICRFSVRYVPAYRERNVPLEVGHSISEYPTGQDGCQLRSMTNKIAQVQGALTQSPYSMKSCLLLCLAFLVVNRQTLQGHIYTAVSCMSVLFFLHSVIRRH